MPGQPWRFTADCGIVSVPLDRNDPDGPTLELRVAVAPAVSRDPAPDPLFLLAGGPGQAATEAFLGILPSLDRIQDERDLVMVDQRGTGRLSPLTCPEDDLDPSLELDDEVLRQAIAECRDQLAADPVLFTTAIATQDLDDVRRALGYEQINLYGGSYGSRAALTYMHTFPERVRTVILDGVVPAAMAVGAEMGRDAQRSLDLLFERCQGDPPCAERFPNLARDFDDLLTRLEVEPIRVELPDPTTGGPTQTLLNRQLAAGTVRFMTYSPQTAALIPLLIAAAVDGDLVPLTAQSLVTTASVSDSISSAMMFSVLCAEDVPFYGDLATEDTESFLGADLADRFRMVCEEWSAADVPAAVKVPQASAIPVLLISGEADPVTPPRWGDVAAEPLSRSLHIVAPGMGHINLTSGCIPKLAAQFIVDGGPEALDPACVDDLRPPPFFVDFTGPAP